MATGASKYLLLSLLSVLTICSSGTQVGFSYDARKNNAILSSIETISFLKLNKVSPSQIRVFVADHRVLKFLSNSSVSVDLYLNETQVEDHRNYKPSVISWLKTDLMTLLPHVNIKSIIVSGDLPGKKNESPLLLSTLKSIHSILSSSHLESQVKVSVSFSLSFLENLNRKQERDLHRILNFIKKTRSFVIVEASVNGELSMGDRFAELAIKRATSAASVLPHSNVSRVLTIKSSAVPSALEVAEFTHKISRSLESSTQIIRNLIGLFAEVSSLKEFEQKELKREEEQMFHSSHRGLLNNFHYKTTLHDTNYPPTFFPTTPITNPSTTPVTIPPDNSPTPTIVTVPSTNPVTITPNPASTPVTIPSTTPVPVPYTPVTNPVTTPITVPGAQPVTNPVTTYPAPTGGVPVTTPVTTPVAPPATTNAPAVPGQSWCVAKTGASEAALQAALDYACGIGGADCSVIQQGASCYNPSTLQNHASYAFNSYYQRNPAQSSCDFGGTAMITNINPSTGSCVYPSSSSSSPLTTSSPTPTTTTTSPPTPTTSPPSGTAVPGSGSPPTVLNTSNPASGTTTVFGESPPAVNTSTSSMSTNLQPFIGCIILATSMITGKFVLDM
uniref:Putative glucan endo-1,3-beta-glucosidase 12 n=1 Tax=Davidia involucrata TaxID=16924 RepID=A0A5B7BTY9_DAVIN